jgi:hypothetical protein
MENVISDYRTALKKKILEKIKNARFYMENDHHPIQYKLIEDILSDDFHVTYSYVMATLGSRYYYITGYLASYGSVFTGNDRDEDEETEY